jgi:hypothetical protein
MVEAKDFWFKRKRNVIFFDFSRGGFLADALIRPLTDSILLSFVVEGCQPLMPEDSVSVESAIRIDDDEILNQVLGGR